MTCQAMKGKGMITLQKGRAGQRGANETEGVAEQAVGGEGEMLAEGGEGVDEIIIIQWQSS